VAFEDKMRGALVLAFPVQAGATMTVEFSAYGDVAGGDKVRPFARQATQTCFVAATDDPQAIANLRNGPGAATKEQWVPSYVPAPGSADAARANERNTQGYGGAVGWRTKLPNLMDMGAQMLQMMMTTPGLIDGLITCKTETFARLRGAAAAASSSANDDTINNTSRTLHGKLLGTKGFATLTHYAAKTAADGAASAGAAAGADDNGVPHPRRGKLSLRFGGRDLGTLEFDCPVPATGTTTPAAAVAAPAVAAAATPAEESKLPTGAAVTKDSSPVGATGDARTKPLFMVFYMESWADNVEVLSIDSVCIH
jgi:hypothetical protein